MVVVVVVVVSLMCWVEGAGAGVAPLNGLCSLLYWFFLLSLLE